MGNCSSCYCYSHGHIDLHRGHPQLKPEPQPQSTAPRRPSLREANFLALDNKTEEISTLPDEIFPQQQQQDKEMQNLVDFVCKGTKFKKYNRIGIGNDKDVWVPETLDAVHWGKKRDHDSKVNGAIWMKDIYCIADGKNYFTMNLILIFYFFKRMSWIKR
jgi:hypothetical protein